MVSSLHVRSRRAAGLLVSGALLLGGATLSGPAQAAPLAPSALITPADDPAGASPVDAPAFTWAVVAGASAYELQLSDDDAFQGPQTVTVTVPRWTPTASLPQNQSFWRVRALQADGTPSPWTATAAFRREWLAPAPALDADGPGTMLAARPRLRLTDADLVTDGVQLPADQLTFSWSPVRGASYYVVDVSIDPGFSSASSPSSPVRRSCRTAHTTFTPYGGAVYSGTTRAEFAPCDLANPAGPFLATGGTYHLRVRAVDETPDGKIITSLWSDAPRPGPAPSTAVPTSFAVVPSVQSPSAAGTAAAPLGDPFPAAPFPDAPLLSWQPVAGAVAYLVGLARDSSFNSSLLDADDLRTDTYWFTSNTELITSQTLLDTTVNQGFFWFALPCTVFVAPGDPANRCANPALAVNTPGRFGAFTKRAPLVAGLSRTVDAANTVSFTWADQGVTAPDGGGLKVYELEVRNAAGAVVDDVRTDNPQYTPPTGTYPDGTYSWRVRIVDASGTTQRWTDGAAFATKAPVPPPPPAALVPEAPGAPGARAGTPVLTTASLKGTQAIAYGRSADIAGALLTTTDAPVAGVTVEIQVLPAGRTTWTPLAKVRTDQTGGFATVVTPERNTRYRAVFAGTVAAAADGSPAIRVSVVPTLTIHASAKRVRRGDTLTFTGRLKPGGTTRKVSLQCRHGKRWTTAATARPSSAGTFRLRLKVTSAAAGRCRAALAASSAYAGGRSRETAFTVR